MKKRRKIEYDIYDGLVISKIFKGKEYRLVVKEEKGTFWYYVNNKKFSSPTSAAKFVQKKDTEVRGPFFWGLPIKNIV